MRIFIVLLLASTALAEPGWGRAMWKPGGGKAELHYIVYGKFGALPPGVVAERADFCRSVLALPGPAEARQAAKAAPACVGVRVEAADPPTLEYLHDALGAVSAAVAKGGVAVYDLPGGKWRSAAEWQKTFAEPLVFQLADHVEFVILPEPDQRGLWLHTRGLEKFGRPEVAVHHAPPSDDEWVQAMYKVAASLAFGMRYPDKAALRFGDGPVKRFVVRRRHDARLDLDELVLSAK